VKKKEKEKEKEKKRKKHHRGAPCSFYETTRFIACLHLEIFPLNQVLISLARGKS
jgi:hypothetical protein